MTHELPEELYSLYRHWDTHIAHSPTKHSAKHLLPLSSEINTIVHFSRQRMDVWDKRYHNHPRPYTHDPILQTFRFCNIYRELDRQTLFFHKRFLDLRDDFPLWLLHMFSARLIANTDTIAKLPQLSFDPSKNITYVDTLKNLPRPKYGTPYVFPISTIIKSAYPDRESFLGFGIQERIQLAASTIASWKHMPVADGVEVLLSSFEFQLSFLWTEVLIDVAYQYPEYIDLFARFPIGPGAKPTLTSLIPSGNYTLTTAEIAAHYPLDLLQYHGHTIPLSAENWEGICCEYRKYKNLSNGRGRKRIYHR